MGIDVKYQAMPPPFPTGFSTNGDDLVTLLFAIARRGVHTGPPPSERRKRIYASVARPILDAHERIDERALYHSSRRWDALHWLLSPERRRSGRSMAGDDLGSAFVCGARVLEGATSTQGMPIRYTPAAEMASVIRFAEAIDAADLGRTLAAEPFVDVYKTAPAAEQSAAGWQALLDYHTELLALHRAAADRGEALLVCFD